MNEQVINIQGGVTEIISLGNGMYTVTDGEGNKFTLTEAQIRSIKGASSLLTEGKQLILG